VWLNRTPERIINVSINRMMAQPPRADSPIIRFLTHPSSRSDMAARDYDRSIAASSVSQRRLRLVARAARLLLLACAPLFFTSSPLPQCLGEFCEPRL
jgi:hypothetical protein